MKVIREKEVNGLRKLMILLATAIISLCLFGCNAPKEEQGSGGMDPEYHANIKEFFEQGAEEKAAVEQYLKDDRILSFLASHDNIGGMIDAIAIGDPERSAELNADIAEKCNAVIEMSNVPEPCQAAHAHIVATAKLWRECASNYNQSASTSDLDKASQLINDGTVAMKNSTEHLDKATAELDKLEDKYNIER